MNRSVRSALIGLWFLLIAICVGLGFFVLELYEHSSENQRRQVEATVARAGESICHRYESYLLNIDDNGAPENKKSEIRELDLLLTLVLTQFDGIEGGFWTPTDGFVCYSFPTYGEVELKKDLPHTELKTISSMAALSLRDKSSQSKHFERERRSLVVHTIPVNALGGAAVIWTMGWSNGSNSDLSTSVTAALCVLFFCSLVSGVWLVNFLYQWSQKVTELERAVAGVAIEELPALPMTGQIELDRVVCALNQVNARLKVSQASSAQLSRELARADKLSALGRMVAGFAHEIRNPLATISLNAENALDGAEGKQERSLKAILLESQALEGLLQRLLTVAKLNELKPKQIVMQSWLKERLEHVHPHAERAGVVVTGDAPEQVWSFDEESISRAFNNLLLNAIQNTPDGGWVKATVTISNGKCLLTVEDSGAGVEEPDRETIFEPLVSGRASGVGIGLTIVREVAAAHGGNVRCLQGVIGAKFEMEIPWLKS